ncbi:N-acetylated-alpha-linked acidic dipeptidase [Granulicella pectinivorans]|uniref:N-acetylated-alpha-linked acidic dipeptidase n=1 Tax=Granulicella pectinivorans TaxID=474950 RepID=A0A1I6L5T2_9BACT|nr:transferrin receptor-like dimerization domain-containing protein [Granulicella pectinivorans]SFR98792.1 N-acetylated-alpha-linked acidic dipeptidase [Granulicella pectinivorans]
MRPLAAVSLLLSFVAQPAVQAQRASPYLGYSAASSATEQTWESKFRALPEAPRVHANMLKLAAHPHHVGSAAQKANAEWVLAQYRSWGWDAHIEQFDVLFPTPKTQLVELLGPKPYTLKLDEPETVDPYTHETATRLPSYNIYSADGDVTAPVVYVNYGMLDDYAELARHNISVKGAIVLARYGGGWRGLKPKLAYEHGAVGCIIYSDPADDGYGVDDVLPKGPMRPPFGAQRGSVSDSPLYAGDPLTPGVGSVPGAKRLKISEAKTIMKIPVLPIGYGDAQPILEALDGAAVPAAWRGGLPLTYHFGPSVAKVHMKLTFNWDTKPVYDVIATMVGSVEPDVWVVRGNHYDGWVNGADDPVSGQSGLLEEARALGELHKQGWTPKRTLIYTAWDGEEPGLIGSTEWAETHGEELSKKVAVYVNSDESNRGFLSAGGSHSMEHLINDVAKDVIDPETKATVWQRQQAGMLTRGGRGGVKLDPGSTTIPIGAIGSGSDFAGFLDHFAIASIDLGFGGEDRSGTYHSAYDTPWFIDHFGDKTGSYGVALAQTAGTLVMRMADADVLPYDFSNLATTIKGYDAELKQLVKTKQQESVVRQRNLDAGLYKLAADPQVPLAMPEELPAPPEIDFSALDQAVTALGAAAENFNQARATMKGATPAQLAALNAQLALTERKFLSTAGLPGRPWVRNTLYAPGMYTGYGAKTIPGVREAIEDGRYPEAIEQMVIAAKAIEDEAKFINEIAASVPR